MHNKIFIPKYYLHFMFILQVFRPTRTFYIVNVLRNLKGVIHTNTNPKNLFLTCKSNLYLISPCIVNTTLSFNISHNITNYKERGKLQVIHIRYYNDSVILKGYVKTRGFICNVIYSTRFTCRSTECVGVAVVVITLQPRENVFKYIYGVVLFADLHFLLFSKVC